MIQKNDLIKELRNRGYVVNPHTVIKNGDVEFQALSIIEKNTPLSPTIYIDKILEMDNLDEAVEAVLNIYQSSCNVPFNADIDLLTNTEFIFNTVRIGIQKTSMQNGIKRATDYDGIEQYLYYGENGWSIRLTDIILENAGISDLQKLWHHAEKNTFSHTTIRSMLDIMRDMMGDEILSDADFGGYDFDMYVITNSIGVKGASAILDKETLKNFAQKHNWNKIAILPSSIHECIIVPLDRELSIDYLNKMVQEVNTTQVLPEDKLSDHVIVLNF